MMVIGVDYAINGVAFGSLRSLALHELFIMREIVGKNGGGKGKMGNVLDEHRGRKWKGKSQQKDMGN
jgi:hypothetical protein